MRCRNSATLPYLAMALLGGACTSSPGAVDTIGTRSPPAHPDTIARPGARVSRQDTARHTRASREFTEALAVDVWKPGSAEACGLRGPAAGGGSVVLFFACIPRTGPMLPAVPARRLTVGGGSGAKESAVAALLSGPTTEERRAGFLSNFGERSAGTPFTIRMRGDTAVIDLDRRIRDVPMIFVGRNDVAQLVATLGQFGDVRHVVIRVGGEPLCRVLSEC
ncbi:MAG TPA: GerMN domain-containing protein [Gemmatimonadaceae bacterium]|jgi:hypothetical protein|nr:GerMN domain-containing protein [Gemmatimonadaceae bacterium]